MADENTDPKVEIEEKAPDTIPAPETVPDSWFWIRNDKGKGSVTVTFLTIAFLATTLWFVASMFESLGPVKMRPIDEGAVTVYFIPLLTLYFGRRWTDANAKKKE
jgi:hypothetical protein